MPASLFAFNSPHNIRFSQGFFLVFLYFLLFFHKLKLMLTTRVRAFSTPVLIVPVGAKAETDELLVVDR